MHRLWFGAVFIFLVGLLLRLYYAVVIPPQVFPDSVSYWRTAQLYAYNKTLVDAWRTPVYPLFLLGVSWGISPTHENIPSLLVIRTVIVQSIIGVLTIVGVYFLLNRLKIPFPVVCIASLLLVSHPFLILFEQTFLTESLAVSWLVGVMSLTIVMIKKPHVYLFFVLFLCLIVGVFLRPSFLLIPIFVLGSVFFFHRTMKTFFLCFVVLLCFGIVIAGYSLSNRQIEGYNGFTRVSEINLLGKIIALDIPTDPNDTSDWTTALIAYRQAGGVKNPWRFLDWSPNFYTTELLNELPIFTKKTLSYGWSYFLFGGLREFPRALVEMTDELPPFQANTVATKVLLIWFRLFQLLHILRFLVIGSAIWFGVRILRSRTLLTTTGFIVSLYVVFHSFTSVLLSYNDFGRHLVVMEPFVYAGTSIFLLDIWRNVKT